MKQIVATIVVMVVACVIGGGVYLYSGAFDAAADIPHTPFVYWVLDTARARSVSKRAAAVNVPKDLEDAVRIQTGSGLYAEMCAECHLAPAKEKTEISQGLYPHAPELARGSQLSPAEQFWIIKHGIKMSGMAAWGRTHSDTLIWDMVAFLRKLPSLTAAQYATMTSNAPEEHEDSMQGMKDSNAAQ